MSYIAIFFALLMKLKFSENEESYCNMGNEYGEYNASQIYLMTQFMETGFYKNTNFLVILNVYFA